MNEIELQKPDYLLALVPLLTFGYPILAFFLGLQFPDFFPHKQVLGLKTRDFLGLSFAIAFAICGLLGWIEKAKLRAMKKEKTTFAAEFLFLPLFVVDIIIFAYIVFLFDAAAEFQGELARFWDLTTGFIFIILIKISFDLHKVPQVYGKVIKEFHDWWRI
ncbi:MAG: hypothetical protein ACE5OZ_25215 [Candidatus Heimdallarchaeota archaeon]